MKKYFLVLNVKQENKYSNAHRYQIKEIVAAKLAANFLKLIILIMRT